MSFILLTKRDKNKILRDFLYGLFVIYLYIGACYLFQKGCHENIQKPNLHGARQFFPIDVDTSKPYSFGKVNLPNQLYLRKIDTLNAIGQNYLGRAMTVDNYIYWNGIFTRILLELRNDTTLKH